MAQTEENLAELIRRLQSDYGVRCLSAGRLFGGGNNVLYRLEVMGRTPLVAKFYFRDERRRLEREFETLSALKERGFSEIAAPFARFDDLDAAVFDFIVGRPKSAAELTPGDVAAIASLLIKLHQPFNGQPMPVLPPAFASAFSLTEVAACIRGRLDDCRSDFTADADGRVAKFVADYELLDFVETRLLNLEKDIGAERFQRQLPREHWRLSPVDFGPHNMLWGEGGSLKVIDFEYGGWDHPMRVIADSLAHDRMCGLPDGMADLLVSTYLKGTSLPAEVLEDLEGYRLLFRLEWIGVLISSMLPEKLRRLTYAKDGDLDVEAYLGRQMKKVLERIRELE